MLSVMKEQKYRWVDVRPWSMFPWMIDPNSTAPLPEPGYWEDMGNRAERRAKMAKMRKKKS